MGSRVLFLLYLVWATTYCKSITPNSENFRKSRQLDFSECCPCPKPEDDTSDQLIFQPDVTKLDDCPCRNRGSELEAASSILSPALQVLRPLISPNVMKKEPEPLLKPEVGLASSVLETLQEVTNEEYQDALARDAVRNVAKDLEIDLPLMQSKDTPGNIINIILNPKETGNDLEVVPEASHIQETRCVPSPIASASNYETKKLKSALFLEPRHSLQKLKKKANGRINSLDMENEASNVQNSLQKPSNAMKSLYEKLNPNELLDNVQNENSFPTDTFSRRVGNSNSNLEAPSRFTKVPDLKLPKFVDSIKKSIQSNPILNPFAKNNVNIYARDKNTPISTTFTEETVIPHKPTNNLNPLILKNYEKPMTLKNLLKLKDVELIPLQHSNNDKTINNIESEEKILLDNDALMNASGNEDDNIKDFKAYLETPNFDVIPSSSNTKITNLKLESSDLPKSPNISNNKAIANTFVMMASDITSTTSKLNLIDKTGLNKQNELIDRKYNPVTEEISIEVESNDHNNNLSDLQTHSINKNIATSEETDPCTLKAPKEIQNESYFNKDINSRKKSDNNILPLIRADIIKSFQSFKKVNDDMQEKLGQNLQNVLQEVDADNTDTKQYTKESIKSDLNKNSNESGNKKKSLTIDNLQKMSDSILNISNMKNKDLFSSASNQNLSENIKPIDYISEVHTQENTENESDKHSSIENVTNDSIENIKSIDKGNENDSSSITQREDLRSTSENPNVLSINQNNNFENQLDLDAKHFENVNPSLEDASDKENTLDIRSKNFNNLLVRTDQSNNENKVDMDPKYVNNEASENYIGISTEELVTNLNNSSRAVSHDKTGCTEINSNEMSTQVREPITNRDSFLEPDSNPAINHNEADYIEINSKEMSVSASEPIVNSSPFLQPDLNQAVSHSEASCTEINSNEINVQASEPIANSPLFLQPDSNQATSHSESGCIEINSNEMNVQASEPIVNRAPFLQLDLNQDKSVKNWKPKYSLGSALKPFSAKIISPNSLNRDHLHQNFVNEKKYIQGSNNKPKYSNLQNVLKKVDKSALPLLERNKQNDVLISDPLNGLELLSDTLKSRRIDSLKTLNGLGVDKNINQKQSNDLYQDVLKNAEDFRQYFSKAHNKLNDKLQVLKMEWNDRIQAISERDDNFHRSTFNRPTNVRKDTLNSEVKRPTLIFDKKRTDTKLTQVRPKTLTNVFSQETFEPFQFSAKPLTENSILSDKRKSILSVFSTTVRPTSIFSRNNPQKKGMFIDSRSKPTQPQATKKAMELQSANKLNMKHADSKTLSSKMDPVTIKKQSVILRPSSQSDERNEIEHTSSSSEHISHTLSNRSNNAESSSIHDLPSNIDRPLQLKAEDVSLLSKLIERVRSSQLISNTIKNNDDHGYHENLQSPSQNIQEIKMAENTLKENMAYKCKMICTKDKK